MSTCFFVTPFNYSAGYPARPEIRPDIRQNRLAGYPAISVSGATLLLTIDEYKRTQTNVKLMKFKFCSYINGGEKNT